MKNIVEFENVNMSYQTQFERVDILQDFNLAIAEGEMTAIVGPSGSGKTTILNLIAGFIKPNSGEIVFRGNNIAKLGEKDICNFRNKHLGYIFQFFNLIPTFNAEENIMVPLLLANLNKSDAEQRVEKLLNDVGLSHRRHHYPEQLSGGEQQRIAIARALSNSPDIILADEPTGNLDRNTGENIWSLLEDIRNQGKTIIVSTHDANVTRIADKVYDLGTLENELEMMNENY